ncbi:hypothetical protein B0T26DRAFT_379092 [Lasiosphaeria miniovina]|uniref:Uncharacterized protein n=1 Tax=Lasiosphaeria miniovina TaxID=1954250 RepID=A0AA40ADI9_9PEZI|nr:uncharacterized protein B0T26DRAFT_379092 [Lasiosphaeria miniovina]KAK0713894.1 hypothetical protein B0T26DRAFT_379092 [Lasiosphaeria miniovina]
MMPSSSVLPERERRRPEPATSSRPTSRQSAVVRSSSKLQVLQQHHALKKTPPAAATVGNLTAGSCTTTTPAGAKSTRITATHPTAPPRQTASTLVAVSVRHPLRVRDQNVAPIRQPLKPLPSSRLRLPTPARMPYERPSPASARIPSAMPQMPTVARAINKQPPLTPKIATRASTTPQQHYQQPQLQQTPTLATPLPRRGPRPESVVLSTNGAVSRDREELASPVTAFLNCNITPRSGSRQGRVNSTNSTPNGTPSLERHDSWETRSGLGILAPGSEDVPTRLAVAFSPLPDAGGGTRQDSDLDSKFFYASGVQKQSQQATSAKPVVAPQQKPATFFYANGDTIGQRDNASPVPLGPVLATPAPTDTLMSKFIYANGLPDLQLPVKPSFSQATGSGSVVSSASRIPTSKPGAGAMQSPYTSPRPSSPVKISPYQASKNVVNSSIPSARSTVSAAPLVLGQANQWKPNSEAHSRSGGASSHTRTGSLIIAEPPAVARIMSAHGSLPSPEAPSPSNISAPPALHTTNPAIAGFASLLQAADEFAEPEEASSESLNSPTKSSSQEGQLTDLVASARRERKVQDLQITNASLEAINRTLERQLRKQTTELRRYRRLSRSGRLSLNSNTGRRIPSDSSVDGGALARAGMGLDDLSEEESELDAQEDESDDEYQSDSEASGELSPNTMAFRDARHRQKDEQRLRLDLSKHQQMLIDSQKINQSLKRCLGWTEELIKEGKRALEYRVRVSEVEIGGRVLAPEDIEAREAREAREANGNADDSGPDGDDEILLRVPKSTFNSENGADIRPWSKDPQDRDSGIELPTDGG